MIDLTVYNPRQHQQYSVAQLASIARDESGRWHSLNATQAPTHADTFTLIPHRPSAEVAVECDGVDWLETFAAVPRGTRLELVDHLHLLVDDTHIEIADRELESTDGRPLIALAAREHRSNRNSQQGGPASATLGRWFEALGALHRWSANRAEFFDDAARFVVDPVGLDGAMVLRKDGDTWHIVASHLPHPEFGVSFHSLLVEQVASAGHTMFHTGHGAGTSLVLAPIHDDQHQVTGMVYGYRATHDQNGRRGIRYMEAQLVELLAQSVGAGLQRLAMEAEAARARVTYEHAFAPAIAAQVELDTATLAGREQEVTVLFADLRGFAALCQQLSTPDTYVLLNEVMDALTTAVMQHGGTLIDYYGDGLAAMWNAPLEQSHHPLLACQAALDMQQALPAVSERWQQVLTAPLQLGIGLHTGTAQVGNIGSSVRLKYGPRGATVNLASRLEQATKLLGSPVVATREVVQRLAGQLLDYRLCQAELPGIESSIDVFAISPPTSDQRVLDAISHYEDALTQFEAGDLDRAKELLQDLPDLANLPRQFLIDQVDNEHHRRLGRRAGDDRDTKTRSTILLSMK
ncbi:adenylate/guanylate cyclase domain-containing protein [Aeoliella mucimassa]|uniref:Adenylate cyclase 1 n=1 Tax=Aeoliella mucimassa TaxID=2527972 RepID=A0A518AKD3_9BACT|nr:adenylate/guanylate cyclase domain-containing protein [Aeoliella mucimassa]QDU55191.1 Adenylate cyclase 1 [Aeoliella mucimassa]